MVDAQRRWLLYLIEAEDGSLYCGITTNVERRFEQHVKGQGAKYFRGRAPIKIAYQVGGLTRSEACKLEPKVKKLPRKVKLTIVATQPSLLELTNQVD